jgi:Cu(I)/Ag(I) efflux system membrane fusion protein
MKKFLPLVFFAFLIAVGGFFYLYSRKEVGDRGVIPSGYVNILSISEDGRKVEIYTPNGKLVVGRNELLVVVKPPGNVESFYFYMPPMPGMGEMREDATLQKVKKGVYRGWVNISMAGQWQLMVQKEGKIMKKKPFNTFGS